MVHFIVFSREGKGSLDELEGSASSDRYLFSQLFCVLIHRGELCAGFVEVTVVEGEWLAVVRDEEAAIRCCLSLIVAENKGVVFIGEALIFTVGERVSDHDVVASTKILRQSLNRNGRGEKAEHEEKPHRFKYQR